MQKRIYQYGLMALIVVFLGLTHLVRIGQPAYRDNFLLPNLGSGQDFRVCVAWAKDMVKSHHTSVGYPPAAAMLFLPFAVLDEERARAAGSLCMIGALFCLIYLSLRESRGFPPSFLMLASGLLTALVYHSWPFQFEQLRGNSNSVVGALCAAGLFALSRGRTVWALVFLTLAAQLRVYPALLIVLVFLRGGFRPAEVFALVNVAALFAFGWANFEAFRKEITALNALPAGADYSQSLASYRVLYGLPWPLAGLKAALLALFGGFILVHLATRRRDRESNEDAPFTLAEVGLIGLSFLVMDLVPNVSYNYKLMLQLIPFLLLITRQELEELPVWFARSLALVAGGAVAFMMVPGWRPKGPGHALLLVVYVIAAAVGIHRDRCRNREQATVPSPSA